MSSDSMNQEKMTEFLSLLKDRDKQFQEERQQLRADFLVRGICDKEVDGLLEDPSLFPKTWLPRHLQWDAICAAEEDLPHLISEAEKLLYGKLSGSIDYTQVKNLISKIH
ncbi:hypothetical protein [Lederbergia galactosidilytica]|uniref:hypothetical protein n=1 Tax=Lederbergia galactosidilytica TaxID=217031 RepID=UPI000717011C|nr:hypothetical protein [Lederbergia galactosidilytica]MBP1915502.1 hypothetical protein [Lederbergia galactosidilytica]